MHWINFKLSSLQTKAGDSILELDMRRTSSKQPEGSHHARRAEHYVRPKLVDRKSCQKLKSTSALRIARTHLGVKGRGSQQHNVAKLASSATTSGCLCGLNRKEKNSLHQY